MSWSVNLERLALHPTTFESKWKIQPLSGADNWSVWYISLEGFANNSSWFIGGNALRPDYMLVFLLTVAVVFSIFTEILNKNTKKFGLHDSFFGLHDSFVQNFSIFTENFKKFTATTRENTNM